MDASTITEFHKQIQKITYLFDKLDKRLRELQTLMETGKLKPETPGKTKFVTGDILLKFN
jgi:hypothetical protein